MGCDAKSGYCYNFVPYQGKENSNEPLGKRVVKNFTSELPESSEVFFDNFFTSLPLIHWLSSKKIKGCGTLLGTCKLDTKKIEKSARGSLDYSYAPTIKTFVTLWKDNRSVCVCSNFCGVNPQKSAQRRQKGQSVTVQMPFSIYNYNCFMGGVDQHDWHIEKYRCSIGGEKWYFKFITYMLDMIVVNSWIIYKQATQENISILEFSRYIANCLLSTSSQSAPKLPGRLPTSLKDIPKEIAIEDNHFLQSTDGSRQRKCKLCKKQVRRECNKCDVGFHLECFSIFHQK